MAGRQNRQSRVLQRGPVSFVAGPGDIDHNVDGVSVGELTKRIEQIMTLWSWTGSPLIPPSTDGQRG